jgi:hypothetical protein
MGERDVMRSAEGFLECVEGAGADVAEDDADGADSEAHQTATLVHVDGEIAARTICCRRSTGRGIDFFVH